MKIVVENGGIINDRVVCDAICANDVEILKYVLANTNIDPINPKWKWGKSTAIQLAVESDAFDTLAYIKEQMAEREMQG